MSGVVLRGEAIGAAGTRSLGGNVAGRLPRLDERRDAVRRLHEAFEVLAFEHGLSRNDLLAVAEQSIEVIERAPREADADLAVDECRIDEIGRVA